VTSLNGADSGKDRWLALFCRANRAEQCRLSGVDRPTSMRVLRILTDAVEKVSAKELWK
jgi:hypothetical protein